MSTKQLSAERGGEGGPPPKVRWCLSQCGWLRGFFGLRMEGGMLIVSMQKRRLKQSHHSKVGTTVEKTNWGRVGICKIGEEG